MPPTPPLSLLTRYAMPLLALFLSACASLVGLKLNERFGAPDPTTFDHPPTVAQANVPDYQRDIRPLLDQRCVTCHACYDAPCQLNLSRYDGITRGASAVSVYSGARLLAAEPSRIGIDAHQVSAWRDKGFFPVLNERSQTREANQAGGVMYRLLAQKMHQAPPPAGAIRDPDLDFSIDRTAVCTTAEGVDDYLKNHPTRGMPFGLPPLSQPEFNTLAHWLAEGAPFSPPPPLPQAVVKQIADWERFLNADELKHQLTARYIYEHWFVGHLWFSEMPDQRFELVRSRTPPGQPIDRIATRRPYDDPGVARVYYRLARLDATPVAKTHMPLRLDAARLARLHAHFIAPPYPITALPGYAPENASNPFVTFRELPLDARYRLMLEEAQFTLMGFMKGPVCRGQVALNSIDDHFWVIFVAPNAKESTLMQRLIDGAMPVLRLPAEHQSTTGLLAWQRYADLEKRYLEGKRKLIKDLGEQGTQPTLKDIWDGDGHNPNAALTVFRHFDSASVERGLIGERPQTAFVMGYPLLERMHYLLTAGFDVFGNVGHQLATRLYMDFLRMESELNFLVFLPQKDRQAVLDHWYRERSQPHSRYFADATAHFPQETGVRFTTRDPLNEFYAMLRQRMQPLREPTHAFSSARLDAGTAGQLEQLGKIEGIAASIMPEDSLLLLSLPQGRTVNISILRNSAHSNVAELFSEAARRLPNEDSLSVQHGVVGAYPNALFAVDSRDLAAFVQQVRALRTPADLTALADRYAIRRSDPRFWSVSDQIHANDRQQQPESFGILDYSRLENF